MTNSGELSSRGAKDVLSLLAENGGNPADIAREQGLIQISDPAALVEVVRGVLAEHANVFEEYKSGKEASLQFLVGQAMKASKGAGNPGLIKELIIKEVQK